MQDNINSENIISEQYKQDLLDKLNHLISVLSDLSKYGTEISHDLNKAYELIDSLQSFWTGNRYVQLVDIFNLISKDLNSDLQKLTKDIPTSYEKIAKDEAIKYNISISSVTYSDFYRIGYLPRIISSSIGFNETEINLIKEEVDNYLTRAIMKIESILDFNCDFYDFNLDIKALEKQFKADVYSLKTNMDNKIEEAISIFSSAENFANTTFSDLNIPDSN